MHVRMRVVEMLPAELQKKLEQGEPIQIIDVREPEEVAMGMIRGARHIPLGELPYRMKEIDPDTEAVLVCKIGYRSRIACQYLMAQGYTNVKNLLGGMLAWSDEAGRKIRLTDK